MDNIFYSIIGKHGGETVDEIISRKQSEIDTCGFSLWSAKIDKKSIEQVWKLSEDDSVTVLCKINNKAKDPVKLDKICRAETMIGPNGNKTIPAGINTTYTEGKNHQAYVFKAYEILKDSIIFNFGPYETLCADNTKKSFRDRFRCFQF